MNVTLIRVTVAVTLVYTDWMTVMPDIRQGRWHGAWWAAAVGAALIALAVAVPLLVKGGNSSAPTSAPTTERARQYSSFQACLLTGARGIADSRTAPVWAGMEDASLRTRAMVSYLAVTGPPTKDNALSYLNSLVLRHCDVIVASGTAQAAAVMAAAPHFSSVKFVLAGGTVDGPVAGANVSAVAAARSAIASVIAADAGTPS